MSRLANKQSNQESFEEVLSAWSISRAKRLCDLGLVLACIPVLAPLLVAIAIAVFVSSGPPVLFRQMRIGRCGRPFRIYKFRTMAEVSALSDIAVAAMSSDQITAIGRVLRRFKLDELPQVFNVLAGDMSLVGPRPKIPAQQLAQFSCRPGITGTATLAFAREDMLFAEISKDLLPDYYRTTVLPSKQQMDTEYMARATLRSDLSILIRTVTGRWTCMTETSARQERELPPVPLRRDVYGAQSLE